IISWYGDDDPANPMNWTPTKKAFVTFCLCLLTFSIYIGSATYTLVLRSAEIPIPSKRGEIGLANLEFGVPLTDAQLGLTLFIVGYGIFPFPLSVAAANRI
ncbi:uncharacterized protein EI90DRAFT_2922395, partial [Cantharellus anzutake]|uniref:uncharacterized protein n=1 Tax=Cantharellus anzutake TaxID=1750568 RepID=UPI001906E445